VSVQASNSRSHTLGVGRRADEYNFNAYHNLDVRAQFTNLMEQIYLAAHRLCGRPRAGGLRANCVQGHLRNVRVETTSVHQPRKA